MKKHSLLAITILILTFFFHNTKNVSAVELLTNGGFETGVTAPWTIQYSGCTDNGLNYAPIANKTTGYNPGFGPTIVPLFGTRYLFVPATCGPQLATGVYYPAGNITYSGI